MGVVTVLPDIRCGEVRERDWGGFNSFVTLQFLGENTDTMRVPRGSPGNTEAAVRQRGRGNQWVRVFASVSGEGKGEAQRAGLGWAHLTDFRGSWHRAAPGYLAPAPQAVRVVVQYRSSGAPCGSCLGCETKLMLQKGGCPAKAYTGGQGNTQKTMR